MLTRRAILKAAGAISALASVPVTAQTPTPTPTPVKPPELLAKLARERYGKFLNDDELPLLDEDMAGLERRSTRLRGYKLQNSEEPAVDFGALRR